MTTHQVGLGYDDDTLAAAQIAADLALVDMRGVCGTSAVDP
jgi:hypothetical protein